MVRFKAGKGADSLTNKRLGEIRKNKKRTPMKIIKYRNSKDIDIMFLDGFNYVKTHIAYENFKNGSAVNPYDRTVYDIGYIGIGEHAIKIGNDKTPAYRVWHEMIARCYAEAQKEKAPTYFNIATVCEEWKCYQTFAEWYKGEQYECDERLHLDKDILYPGNKVYSPYTCMLVPQRINSIFSNKSNKRKLPTGVKKHDQGYQAEYSGKNLGVFRTVEKAFEAYAREKENAVKIMADEYKDVIPEKVYNALYEYKFKIEDDKNYKQPKKRK